MALFIPTSGSGTYNLYWHSTASWLNPTSSISGPGVGATFASFQAATRIPGPNDDVYLCAPWTTGTMNISMRALTGSLSVKRIHALATGSWTSGQSFTVTDVWPGINTFSAPEGIWSRDTDGVSNQNTFGGGFGVTWNITGSLHGFDGNSNLNPAFAFGGANSIYNLSGSIYKRANNSQNTSTALINALNVTLNIDGDVIMSNSGDGFPVLQIASSYATVNIRGNVWNLANNSNGGPCITINEGAVGTIVNINGVTSRDYVNQTNVVIGQTTSTLATISGSDVIRITRAANASPATVINVGTLELPATWRFPGTGSLIQSNNGTAGVGSSTDTNTTVTLYTSTFNITTTGSKLPFNVPRLRITASNIAIATSSASSSRPFQFGQSNVTDPTPATTDVYSGVVYGLANSKTGVLTTPSSSNVRSTITYSSGSVGSTPSSIAGTANIPPQNDVRFGISYDTAPSGGRMIVPLASQVSNSFKFDNTTGSYSGSKDFWATPHSTMTTGIGQQISQSLNTRAGSITGSMIGLLDTDTSNTVTRLRSIASVADVGNALTQSANI